MERQATNSLAGMAPPLLRGRRATTDAARRAVAVAAACCVLVCTAFGGSVFVQQPGTLGDAARLPAAGRAAAPSAPLPLGSAAKPSVSRDSWAGLYFGCTAILAAAAASAGQHRRTSAVKGKRACVVTYSAFQVRDAPSKPGHLAHVEVVEPRLPTVAPVAVPAAAPVQSCLLSDTFSSDALPASTAPAAATSKSTPFVRRRMRAARRAGSARRCSRTRRSAFSQAASAGLESQQTRRRIGARLQSHRYAMPEEWEPSYDPSRLRSRIQVNVRTRASSGMDNGREAKTPSASVGVTGKTNLSQCLNRSQERRDKLNDHDL